MITEEQKEAFQKMHTKELSAIYVIACENDNLELCKYLLTSRELKVHANVSYANYNGFMRAIRNESMNVIHYLLTEPKKKAGFSLRKVGDTFFKEVSEKLTQPTDVHMKNDLAFIYAHQKGLKKLLNYLIFDYKIDITETLDNYIKDEPELLQQFQSRDLHNQLTKKLSNTSLATSNKQTSKTKI